jgi:hypothetical protein
MPDLDVSGETSCYLQHEACGTGFVRRLDRECCLAEELLEDVEVPTALHFFGIPADDSFRRIA